MGQTDHRAGVREFLSSRRANVTPEQAGLPVYWAATQELAQGTEQT